MKVIKVNSPKQRFNLYFFYIRFLAIHLESKIDFNISILHSTSDIDKTIFYSPKWAPFIHRIKWVRMLSCPLQASYFFKCEGMKISLILDSIMLSWYQRNGQRLNRSLSLLHLPSTALCTYICLIWRKRTCHPPTHQILHAGFTKPHFPISEECSVWQFPFENEIFQVFSPLSITITSSIFKLALKIKRKFVQITVLSQNNWPFSAFEQRQNPESEHIHQMGKRAVNPAPSNFSHTIFLLWWPCGWEGKTLYQFNRHGCCSIYNTLQIGELHIQPLSCAQGKAHSQPHLLPYQKRYP